MAKAAKTTEKATEKKAAKKTKVAAVTTLSVNALNALVTAPGNVSINGDGSVTIDYKRPRSSKRIVVTVPVSECAVVVEGTEDAGYIATTSGYFNSIFGEELVSATATYEGVENGMIKYAGENGSILVNPALASAVLVTAEEE